MGASHSTPPPLVEVNAPGGKVLVPPGNLLPLPLIMVYSSYARSRSEPYVRGPIYTPCPPGRRPRPRVGPRYGGPNIDILEGSEESESTLPDMMEGMSPRGMRRQPSKGYPGGAMGGGGMPGMGRRGGPGGLFAGMDERPRSAPEMQIGGYPGMMGGVPMGMPGSPGLGAMRGLAGMGGGMGPGAMGGMGAMGGGRPPSGMPPEYTSNPSMPPRFGAGGGVPGPGMNNPYANQAGPPSSQSSSSSPDPPQTTRRTPGRKQNHYEHIPMGAYANAEKPRRPRAEAQTSARLNRGQPSHKKVGPSGEDWIEGDNAWLDACTCTTGCNCRKSHRVLYRSQADPHHHRQGSDSDDEEDHLRTSGEIRYVLKTDLGRDCGDHTACRKSSDSSSSDSDSDSSTGKDGKKSKSKKKKEEKEKKLDKKQDKKRKDQFDTFKDDILEALDERFHDLKQDGRQQQQRCPDTSESPVRQQQAFSGPNMGPTAFMRNQDMDMNPRIAQHMGMLPGDHVYGTGRMPPGMADPKMTAAAAAGGKRGLMHPSMGMGMGMGGMNGMGPAGMGGGGPFENDMLSEMDDMGLNMHMNMGNNPYMQPGGGMPGMMGNNGLRQNFMSHRGAAKGATGRQFSNGAMGMGMDMDQMAAMYAKAMGGGGGGGGRAGMMMGGGGGRRRTQLSSSSDDFDLGPGPSIRSVGMRQQQQAGGGGGGGRDRAGRTTRRSGIQDKDNSPITGRRRYYGGGSSPLARNTNNNNNNTSHHHNYNRNNNGSGSLDRGKQARVDTDDDDDNDDDAY